MDYALRIRIMHQAPKARRRGLCTTHYVSVLCIQAPQPSAGLCVRAGGSPLRYAWLFVPAAAAAAARRRSRPRRHRARTTAPRRGAPTRRAGCGACAYPTPAGVTTAPPAAQLRAAAGGGCRSAVQVFSATRPSTRKPHCACEGSTAAVIPRLHLGFTSAPPRLHLGFTWAALRLHLGCTWATLRLHLGFTWATLRLHLGSTWATLRLHLGSTWATLRLHLGCTSATSRLYPRLEELEALLRQRPIVQL